MTEQNEMPGIHVSFLPTEADYIEQQLLLFQYQNRTRARLPLQLGGSATVLGGLFLLFWMGPRSGALTVFADLLILAGFGMVFLMDLILPYLTRARAKRAFETSRFLRESRAIAIDGQTLSVGGIYEESAYPLGRMLAAIEGDDSFVFLYDDMHVWQLPRRLLTPEENAWLRERLRAQCGDKYCLIQIESEKRRRMK